jgi:hypothetical protein
VAPITAGVNTSKANRSETHVSSPYVRWNTNQARGARVEIAEAKFAVLPGYDDTARPARHLVHASSMGGCNEAAAKEATLPSLQPTLRMSHPHRWANLAEQQPPRGAHDQGCKVNGPAIERTRTTSRDLVCAPYWMCVKVVEKVGLFCCRAQAGIEKNEPTICTGELWVVRGAVTSTPLQGKYLADINLLLTSCANCSGQLASANGHLVFSTFSVTCTKRGRQLTDCLHSEQQLCRPPCREGRTC